MAAVVQDITAEQGAALAVTLTGAGASLQGRTLRMHVRSKVGVTTTKLVASTTDGRLTVGANPYTTATLAIDADIMAAVSITLPTEYWVYDVESYTTAADVRREWSGRFTITRDVTRDTEATTETALSGAVLYSGPQSLTTAQQDQAWDNIGGDEAARDAIGAALVAGSNVTITVSDVGNTITIAATGGGGGGSGDVVGPASATDDRIAAFDGTTGKLIKEGSVTATAVASHLGSTSNPHSVTAAQVGADATGTAAGAVSTHNAVTTAHGISAFGATLVDDADAATARTTLGLGTAATSATGDFAAASHAHAASAITSGTLVHERGGLEADVSAYSGLVKITGGVTSAVTVTAAGEALLDDADASAQRATLGLGGAAVLAVGTTAGTVAAGDDSRLADDRTASGLRETSGPTVLVLGAVADGEYIKRVGSTAVGGTPAGGSPGGSSGQLQYNNAAAFGGANLWRVDANTLWQYNGTTAQAFYVSNTRTDDGNYERGRIQWVSNVLTIGTQKAGTGTARALELQTDGTTRITIPSSESAIRGNELKIYFNASDSANYLITKNATTMRYLSANHYISGNLIVGVDSSFAQGITLSSDANAKGSIQFANTVNGAAHTITVGSKGSADQQVAAIEITGHAAGTAATTNISGAPIKLTGGAGASGSSGAANGGAVNLDGGQGYGTGSHGDVIVGATRGVLRLPARVVSALPAATTAGRRCFVSDATATTFHSVVAGGGSNFVPVFSDGTNWRIG